MRPPRRGGPRGACPPACPTCGRRRWHPAAAAVRCGRPHLSPMWRTVGGRAGGEGWLGSGVWCRRDGCPPSPASYAAALPQPFPSPPPALPYANTPRRVPPRPPPRAQPPPLPTPPATPPPAHAKASRFAAGRTQPPSLAPCREWRAGRRGCESQRRRGVGGGRRPRRKGRGATGQVTSAAATRHGPATPPPPPAGGGRGATNALLPAGTASPRGTTGRARRQPDGVWGMSVGGGGRGRRAHPRRPPWRCGLAVEEAAAGTVAASAAAVAAAAAPAAAAAATLAEAAAAAAGSG